MSKPKQTKTEMVRALLVRPKGATLEAICTATGWQPHSPARRSAGSARPGSPFRILTIVDCHTREALATCARTNFRAYQVVEELDRIARQRGKPQSIRVDNVLCRELLAAWVSRSWGIRCSGCPNTVAQTGSAVKK